MRLNLPLPVQVGLVHLCAWLASIALLPSAVASFWLGLLFSQGIAAGVISQLIGLPVWWRWINLLFFPLIGLAQQLAIAPAWYLLALLLLLLTQFGALRSRVPLYLSSQRAKAELTRLLPTQPGLSLLDIGSGMGGLLAHLARSRPDLKLSGIESAPLLWLFSRLRLGRRADIRFGDLWQADLSVYDVVYAFLSPEPMTRLWHKARREMKPGSLFVSNSFAVPGIPPDAEVALDDLHHGRLLIWRLS